MSTDIQKYNSYLNAIQRKYDLFKSAFKQFIQVGRRYEKVIKSPNVKFLGRLDEFEDDENLKTVEQVIRAHHGVLNESEENMNDIFKDIMKMFRTNTVELPFYKEQLAILKRKFKEEGLYFTEDWITILQSEIGCYTSAVMDATRYMQESLMHEIFKGHKTTPRRKCASKHKSSIAQLENSVRRMF